jgi:hypothetical protein
VSELRVQKATHRRFADITRITASLATFVVAAAAGSTAWGVIAQNPAAPAAPPASACYIETPGCNDTPDQLDPGIAGACYIEDPYCNDTPDQLDLDFDTAVGEVDAYDPVAEAPAPGTGLIAPDAELVDPIDPLA